MNRTGIAWTAALLASAPFYAWADSLAHFVWHVGYGAAAGLLLAGAIRRWTRLRPDPWRIALASYAYMVVPDLIWLYGLLRTGTPFDHEPWMDIFLLHYSLDAWPLATLALLVVFPLAWSAGTRVSPSQD